MKQQHWYKLKEDSKQKFIDRTAYSVGSGSHINEKLVKFIDDRPFLVIEANGNSVKRISFDGASSISPSQASFPGYMPWIVASEYNYFEEVKDPHNDQEEQEAGKLYGCMVMIDGKLSVTAHSLTYKDAVKWAEEFLESNGGEESVTVFKPMVIVKSEFKITKQVL